MSDEPLALSTISPAPLAEGDYDAICSAVMHSVRGRWFLEEYARRNRHSDTEILLAAIERIERVVRGDRSQQAYQSFRVDLLEMAKTIAQTRAEVVSADAASPSGSLALPTGGGKDARRAEPPSEIVTTAERIQEIAWTMRERGIDPATCEQIDSLATSILAASSLRDPTDSRAQKLGEVLHHLEHRIESMLDACAEVAAKQAEENASEIPDAPVAPPPSAKGHETASGAHLVHDTETSGTSPEVLALESQAEAETLTSANDAASPSLALAAEPTMDAAAAPQAAPEPPLAESGEMDIEPLVVAMPVTPVELSDEPAATLDIEPLAVASPTAATQTGHGKPQEAEPGPPSPGSFAPLPAPPVVTAAAPPEWTAVQPPAPLAATLTVTAPLPPPETPHEEEPPALLALAVIATPEPLASITVEPPAPALTAVAVPVVVESPPSPQPESASAAPVIEPKEVDVLAAAWETAISNPPPELKAGAPEPELGDAPSMWAPRPVGPVRSTEPTPETDPADFLFEPLPEAPAATATQADTDVMAEVEEDLFENPLQPIPPRAMSVPQPVISVRAAPAPAPTPEPQQRSAPMARATPPAPARQGARPMPRPTPGDPLAPLNAMSDEERIALFT